MTSDTPRVGLFGPYVSRNLGDTATQMAVIQNLRRRCPRVQLIGVSPEPEDTLDSLGIPAFPLSGLGPMAGDLHPYVDKASAAQSDAWRRPYSPVLVSRIDRFVRTLDLLIVSGGGQFDDFWGGAWNHPWSMLLWTALARRHGVPVIYLAVGVDGLKAPLSRRFSVAALRLANWRLFRDPVSLETMQEMGFRNEALVCPDLVFALDAGASNPNAPLEAPSRFVVLSPISRKTWSRQETAVHERYLDMLLALGGKLADSGYELRIVCSQSAMDTGDALALAGRLREQGVSNLRVVDSPRVMDFIQAVSGADLVVASRLHGVILSLLAGCPVVALAHLGKVQAVMREFGLSDYCHALQKTDYEALQASVASALSRRDVLRGRVAAVANVLRLKLAGVFDGVLRHLRRGCNTSPECASTANCREAGP